METKSKKRTSAGLLASALALTLGIAAGNIATANETKGDSLGALLRVANASGGTVDIYNGAIPYEDGLEFPGATNYSPIDTASSTTLVVRPSGSLTTLYTFPSEALADDSAYTAVVFGEGQELDSLFLTDDLSNIADPANVRLRVTHVANGIENVDIYVRPTGGAFSLLLDDAAYGTSSEYVEVPAISGEVGLDADEDGNVDFVFNIGTLSANSIVDIFAMSDSESVFLYLSFDGPGLPNVIVRPEDSPELRAIHVTAGAPSFAFVVNDSPLFEGVGHGQGSDYKRVDDGTNELMVLYGDTASSPVLATASTDFEPGKSYTVAAWSNHHSDAILVLEDVLSTTPTMSLLRGINTTSGIGSLDISIATNANLLTPISETIAAGKTSGFVPFDPGSYILALDSGRNQTPDYFYELPTFFGGEVLNVFAARRSDDGVPILYLQQNEPVDEVITIEPSPFSTLRAVHLSPNGGSIDIWSGGGSTGIQGLGFTDGSGSVPLFPGTYDFQVVPEGGTDADSVLDIDATLLDDTAYTVAVYDNISSPSSILLVDDLSPVNGRAIRLRGIHAAPSVGEVDILLLASENVVLFEDVQPGDASDAVELSAVAYDLGIDVDNDLNPELVFEIPALPYGTIVNAFIVRDKFGVFLLAQLNGGATTVRIDPKPVAIGSDLAFNFEEGSQNWTFDAPAAFSRSIGEAKDGQLQIISADNTNSFAFWESPRLTIGDVPSTPTTIKVRGTAGAGSLYRIESVVKSDDTTTSGSRPNIRQRVSAYDFREAHVLVASSEDDASYSPSPDGTLYRSYFSLQSGDEDFRLDFDMMNFDADNATSATVALESTSIEFIGTTGLGVGDEELSLDFTETGPNGFGPTTAAPLVATDFDSTTPGGLTIRYTGEALEPNEAAFGFWFLDSDVTLEANKLYRIRWTVGSDATAENAAKIPVFRLRINDSTFKAAMYVNVDSTVPEARLPIAGAPQTYDMYFETPDEVAGNDILFAFDYLLTGDSNNDGSIGVSLEQLEVMSFDVPEAAN